MEKTTPNEWPLDTIAAIATPVGAGGIGIIRVSGPESVKIVKSIFSSKETDLQPRYVYYGNIHDGSLLIDEACVTYFQGPKSYTGEDVVEIQAHGGQIVLHQILENVLKIPFPY